VLVYAYIHTYAATILPFRCTLPSTRADHAKTIGNPKTPKALNTRTTTRFTARQAPTMLNGRRVAAESADGTPEMCGTKTNKNCTTLHPEL